MEVVSGRALDPSQLDIQRIDSWVARPRPLSAFTACGRSRSRVGNLIGNVTNRLELVLSKVQRGSRQPEAEDSAAMPDRPTFGQRPTRRTSNAASLEHAQRVIRKIVATQPGHCWRFRHLQQATSALVRQLEGPRPCWVYLNPARCWAVLQPTNPALAADQLPLNTLIYQCGNQFQGLVADLEGQVLINELADYQPCSLAEWSRLSSLASATQLAVFVRRLAACGLVALG